MHIINVCTFLPSLFDAETTDFQPTQKFQNKWVAWIIRVCVIDHHHPHHYHLFLPDNLWRVHIHHQNPYFLFYTKSLISALRIEEQEQGGISEERWARIHESSLHGSLLPADTPPCWISIIDWMLQLIGLIWHITTSLSGDRLQIKLKCFIPKFYILFVFWFTI